MSSHCLESKASTCTTVTWKDKHSECLSSSSSPLFSFYCQAWCHRLWNIPLGSWGQLSCYVLSQVLAHPQSTCLGLGGRAEWEEEGTLTMGKYCLAIAKILCVISTWAQIQNSIAWVAMKTITASQTVSVKASMFKWVEIPSSSRIWSSVKVKTLEFVFKLFLFGKYWWPQIAVHPFPHWFCRTIHMWWLDLPPPVTVLFPFLNNVWRKNRMKKLMGQYKDKEQHNDTYQLLSQPWEKIITN